MFDRHSLLLALPAAMLLASCDSRPAEAAGPPTTVPPSGAGLTVVELYQSQGCSSCPPAIRNANALAGRKDLLVLMFSVTYWDYLGWKDVYGKPAFTARQRDYADGLGNSRVYTPQIVVNGSAALVGDRPDEIRSVIKRSGQVATIGVADSAGGSVTLAAMPSLKRPADLWLVRYDPKSRNVPVRAGENAGRTIAHRDIVVDLKRLGSWNGKAAKFALPPASEPGLSTALLAQAPHGGALLAAAKL